MKKIKSIRAREILDSRGNPSIEVEVETDYGISVASVPSGASKGKYEAKEIRDGSKRYQGRGVLKAVRNVNKIIAPKLIGKSPTNQKEIDSLLCKLDGTKNKSHLGANAILGISMAVCRAGALVQTLSLFKYINQLFYSENNSSGSTSASTSSTFFATAKNVELPIPCFNVINGGVHAGNNLDFQEFMIVPKEKFFPENLKIATEIYHSLKKVIFKKYGRSAINIGDEGGFAPPIKEPERAIELILKAAKKLNYENKIGIIVDIAASQFFKNKRYQMKIGKFNRERLLNYYLDLTKKYPIIGLEDPFAEDDWRGWQELKLKIKNEKLKILIIGDDLLATNLNRIKEAEEKAACNAVIIKPNQIGTVTEAIEAAKLAKSYKWKVIVSHRSGETNDDFISDFATGIVSDFIKAGAPSRGERVAKYNRLLKINEELKKK